jgi:hypothetical protein
MKAAVNLGGCWCGAEDQKLAALAELGGSIAEWPLLRFYIQCHFLLLERLELAAKLEWPELVQAEAPEKPLLLKI